MVGAGHPYIKTPNIDRIGERRRLSCLHDSPRARRREPVSHGAVRAHGITDNVDRSAASHQLQTFPNPLHQSGYETAFIGKWHMGNDDRPRPGFDRWVSFKGQGTYLNAELNEDGKSVKSSGYITDVLNGYAIEFIKRSHTKPFLVYLAHKAIHPEVTQNNDGSVNLAAEALFRDLS
jgi:N-acetylglucosamine-6-sulfatase